MELCRFSTNCTFAGQCIFRTMPRHGLRDEFKADRASGSGESRGYVSKIGAACIPRLIIPAIFYYGRAFIYHARIVNRGTLHRGREEPRIPIRSTAGLNQIRPLSYIIVCPSTTLAIQFFFFFTFLNLIRRLYILYLRILESAGFSTRINDSVKARRAKQTRPPFEKRTNGAANTITVNNLKRINLFSILSVCGITVVRLRFFLFQWT